VFTAALALYAFSLGVRSDGQLLGNDAMPYASQLVADAPGGMWNAHHLLFHLLVAAIAGIRGLLGGLVDEITVLEAQRLVSAFGGAATVTVLFGFAARRAGLGAGLLLAALFATAYGNWLLSSVGETYTPATALVCLVLVRAAETRLGERRENVPALAGLVLLALLFRQDSVLVLVALPFLLSPRAAFATVVFAGLTSLALYVLAWALSGIDLAFLVWLRGLAGTGIWGHAPRAGDFGLSAGLTATALHYGFVPLRRVLAGRTDELASPQLLSAFATVLALGVALLPTRRLAGPTARVAFGFAAYALARWLFFTWWEPSNVEYHTGTLLPLALLVALVLPAPGAHRSTRPIVALGAAFVLVAAGNFTIAIGPNRVTTNSEYAREAARLAGDGGLVVALEAFAAHALLREPPRLAARFDATRVAVARDAAQLPELRARIDETLGRGANVVLFRAIGIWERLLLAEPSIDLELVAALQEGCASTPCADDRGAIWAVVVRAD
jgi:hypothetical protein